jgi:lipopolysaccharide transport system permease protein
MSVSLPQRTVVLKPNQSWLSVDWSGLWLYRDLLTIMVQRDFTSKYKQTILGPLWFIINPVINAAVFTIVFAKALGVSTNGVPPMLAFLCSQLAWGYFSSVLATTSNSLAGNAGLFGKVYFPRLIPPLAMCASCLIAFLVQLTVLICAWLVYKFFTPYGAQLHFNWMIVLLPVVLVQLAALGLGIGLILSSITAKYRDLMQLTGFLVQMWFFATPVIFTLESIPDKWRWAINLNPLTPITEFTRVIFLGRGVVIPYYYGISVAVTAVFLVIGVLFYQRMARTFVDTV